MCSSFSGYLAPCTVILEAASCNPTRGQKLPSHSFPICASAWLLLRNCLPRNCFPHRQVRLKLLGSAIPILPTYCLLLLHCWRTDRDSASEQFEPIPILPTYCLLLLHCWRTYIG